MPTNQNTCVHKTAYTIKNNNKKESKQTDTVHFIRLNPIIMFHHCLPQTHHH